MSSGGEETSLSSPLTGGAVVGSSKYDAVDSEREGHEESLVGTNPTQNLVGRGLLIFVAFLYGTLNVTLRWVYTFPGPPSASALSSSRGWLAYICFIPLLLLKPAHHPRDDDYLTRQHALPPLWKVAFELAFWNFGAQGLLNLGLITTESARASFLTQCSVVMTPVVSALAGQRIKSVVWIACFLALIGLLLLSSDGGIGNGLSMGDFIVLAGALSWSIYIFRLSSVGGAYDEIELQGKKTFFLALLYSGWFLAASYYSEVSLWPGYTSLASWGLIFYSALGPGMVADVVQQKGQANIPAAESNIILSMEPVFTALLGRLLLGETTSLQEKLGGGLILIAALVASQ